MADGRDDAPNSAGQPASYYLVQAGCQVANADRLEAGGLLPARARRVETIAGKVDRVNANWGALVKLQRDRGNAALDDDGAVFEALSAPHAGRQPRQAGATEPQAQEEDE